jgi:hypothetical protein
MKWQTSGVGTTAQKPEGARDGSLSEELRHDTRERDVEQHRAVPQLTQCGPVRMADAPRGVIIGVDRGLKMHVSARLGLYSPMDKNAATAVQPCLDKPVGSREVL